MRRLLFRAGGIEAVCLSLLVRDKGTIKINLIRNFFNICETLFSFHSLFLFTEFSRSFSITCIFSPGFFPIRLRMFLRMPTMCPGVPILTRLPS